MTTMAGPRKSLSIQDYPEHLNPFHEEDNHNKIRFWTIGRKLNRSNSITFSGIKDLKNSWAFRSFMKKGKKGQQTEKSVNGNNESSPIVYRRALQYSSTTSTMGSRSTVASPERYVYGGSVTPLPRSRFQERLRSSSQHEVNSLSTPRMARSEVTGSRLSVGSTNPFEGDGPVPPMRSRRKKKRAPLPPGAQPIADVSITSESSELHISETNDSKISHTDADLEITEEIDLNVELKIVEDEDVTQQKEAIVASPNTDTKDKTMTTNTEETAKVEVNELSQRVEVQDSKTETTMKTSDSEDDILSKASFPKIDITKYRRNSSVNDDDIRLRRGNLEDYHALAVKRSKSLTNALDSSYTTYDINLNEEITKDSNGNEPQKVICKLYEDTPSRQSVETVSSTEKEFIEIDRATRELEREISKLNSALNEDDKIAESGARLSVSDIKKRFDNKDVSSPNPIPKPRRSHYGDSISPVNGNIKT